MIKYFDNIHFFDEEKDLNIKCDCKKKINTLKNGKFTLKGRFFYSKKIPFLFCTSKVPIWKYVINTTHEIFEKGYVPTEFPLIILQKGIFQGKLYVEISPFKGLENNKKDKRLKTFNDTDNQFLILENSENTDKFQALLNFYTDLFKMSPRKKLRILINLLRHRIFQIYFHCPLCDPKDPIISVFFI